MAEEVRADTAREVVELIHEAAMDEVQAAQREMEYERRRVSTRNTPRERHKALDRLIAAETRTAKAKEYAADVECDIEWAEEAGE